MDSGIPIQYESEEVIDRFACPVWRPQKRPCGPVATRRSWLLLPGLAALLLLNACSQTPGSEQPLPASVQVATEPPAAPQAAEPHTSTGAQIESLLLAAERALAAGRLTRPRQHSAWHYFNQVLALQPDHTQARAGLDDIVLRYAQMIRAALGRGHWHAVRTYLERSEAVLPGNPLSASLREDYRRARAQQEEAQARGGEVVDLDQRLLEVRSERLQQLFAELAGRLQRSGESILIVARNDAEGRWIYQQLNKAAGPYRVRGDIDLGSPARIHLLPPL